MKVANKTSNYDRIGVLSIEEVFYYIEKKFNDNIKKRVQIKEFNVNVQSLRLKTFYATGVECYCCQNTASFFAVERAQANINTSYHLNLYGIDKDNNEVLFTHDHIIARGLGGTDSLDNSKTMCGPCNWEKGKLEAKMKQFINADIILSQDELNELTSKLEYYKNKVKKHKVKI